MSLRLTDEEKKSTTKKIVALLLTDFIILQIVACVATFMMLFNSTKTGIVDFSPLNALIGAVIGEVITFLVYAAKSFLESKEEGHHEVAMKELDMAGEYTPDPSGEGEA